MMGYAFLYSGETKLTAAEPFSATNYPLNAGPTGNPVVELFHWAGNTPWFADFLTVAVPWGELLIGIALLVGVFIRLTACFGVFMMLLFYFGNWDVAHSHINGDCAYMLVCLAVAAFGAGRILRWNAVIEQYGLGRQALIEKYPRLRYILE